MRSELFRRVPWLEDIWCNKNLEFAITGSLLAEAVSPIPGITAIAGDVDLFSNNAKNSEVLMHAVVDAMCKSFRCDREYMKIENKSIGRYRVTAMCDHSLDVGLCAFHCDIYINSFACVACYHLPLVRMCLYNTKDAHVKMTPSCTIAHITRICVDYHYFASKTKSPYDIIIKKWRSGYNFCVTARERRQLLYYARSMYPEMFQFHPLNIVKEDKYLWRHYILLPRYNSMNLKYNRCFYLHNQYILEGS